VQGLAFDDAGRVYAVEFGQNRFDEVNLLARGSNGGWPQVEGPGDGGAAGGRLGRLPGGDGGQEATAAVVGDTLYVAALRGQRLWQVPLSDPSRPRPLYQGQYGRLRAAARAPDGSLWVLTSNRDGRGDPVGADDRILRLARR
jgi:glucose/arabinose dehydrogenase